MKLIAKLMIVLILSCSSALETAQAAIGLSTRFVDVTLEYVPVGRPLNLRRLRNIPYTVKNTGSAPINVKVDVTLPKKDQIREGYEAIPDPTWIQIVPNIFTIPAGQTAYAEMVIQIPEKPEFTGKHYQSTIWAHTQNGGLFAAGTESNFKFSTGPGPETLKEEAKEKVMMTLDFDITPAEIYVSGVEPGKKVNLNSLIQKKLKVANRAATPIHLKFKSVPWSNQVILPAGYESAPDPSWLSLKPNDEIIKEDRIATIDPILTIPPGDEHRGKRYAFLVKADIVLGIDVDMFTKVLVTVNSKKE